MNDEPNELTPEQRERINALTACPDMPEDELKQFVRDVIENRVYLMQYMTQPSLVGSVFMAIGLGGLRYRPDTIGTIYEYLDEAGPRSINGMPMFMSCRFVSMNDWNRVLPVIDRAFKQLEDIEIPSKGEEENE